MFPKAAGGSPEAIALPGEGEVQLTAYRETAAPSTAPTSSWDTGPLGGAPVPICLSHPTCGNPSQRAAGAKEDWHILAAVGLWDAHLAEDKLSEVILLLSRRAEVLPTPPLRKSPVPTWDHSQTQTVSWVAASGTCRSSCRSQEAFPDCSLPDHQPADLSRAAGNTSHHSNGPIQTFILWDNSLNFEFLCLYWLLAFMFLNSSPLLPERKCIE